MSNTYHELQDKIEQLNPDQQKRVLDFVQTLETHELKGTPGRELLRFGGAISKSELDIISSEIETGCEQVNPNEW